MAKQYKLIQRSILLITTELNAWIIGSLTGVPLSYWIATDLQEWRTKISQRTIKLLPVLAAMLVVWRPGAWASRTQSCATARAHVKPKTSIMKGHLFTGQQKVSCVPHFKLFNDKRQYKSGNLMCVHLACARHTKHYHRFWQCLIFKFKTALSDSRYFPVNHILYGERVFRIKQHWKEGSRKEGRKEKTTKERKDDVSTTSTTVCHFENIYYSLKVSKEKDKSNSVRINNF